MTALRVATVGTGYFSQFHYDAWTRMADVDLVGVCNRTLAKAEAFAERYRIEAAYSNLEEMIEQSKPDLLDIITPPETHAEAITAAARFGVDAICQKPFCLDLSTAEAAVSIAEAAGIKVIIHENFRFQPWYGVLKQELTSGRIGEVFQVTFRLRPGDGQGARAYMDRQPYFQTMPRLLVHETAIHLVDVFRYLLGEPHSVQALLSRLNPAIKGEDAGLIVFEFEGGPRALFDGNRLSDHAAENRRRTMGEMLIEGSQGVLRLDGDANISFRAHGENDETKIDYSWDDIGFGGDCVYRCNRHVVDHLRHGATLMNTARDYLQNIRIEEAIYLSHAEGRRVALKSSV